MHGRQASRPSIYANTYKGRAGVVRRQADGYGLTFGPSVCACAFMQARQALFVERPMALK